MIDDTNELSPSDLALLEQDRTGVEVADTPEKVAEETEKTREEPKPEVKEEPKQPTEIEVVSEEEADSVEPDARKYIKVGVLRKEREAKKQLRHQLEQAQQQLAQFQRQQEPPRQLTPEEVPQQALEEVREVKRALQEQAAREQFLGIYRQKATEYMAEQPDFMDAYNHAVTLRRQQYELTGFAPQQVEALLQSEESAIVERALLDGVNPAKRIYDVAQKVYGYKPKAAEVEKADPVSEQVQRQEKTADKTLEAAKKLEKIAKGMDKNKSLSGAGGGNEAPGLEELAMMSLEDFEKHTSGAKFKELMGG